MKKQEFGIKRFVNNSFGAAIAALAAAAFVSGCGAVSSVAEYYAGSGEYDEMVAETAAAADSAIPVGARMMASGSNADMAEMEAAAGESDYNDTGSGSAALTEGEAGSAGADPSDPIERKLIKTVYLTMQTTDFEELNSSIESKTAELGGYVESSGMYGGGINNSDDLRSSDITVRIPSDKLDLFLNTALTGGTVVSRNENTEDITLTYTDLEARVSTLTVERDRLMELLAEADSVDSIIALESRLSEIRYELESIESSLRVYDNQVTYSTVYINIQEVNVVSATGESTLGERISAGFEKNLLRLMDSVVDLFVWFVTNIPALILTALVIAVIAAIVKGIIAHHRKKRQKKEAAGQAGTSEPKGSGSVDTK